MIQFGGYFNIACQKKAAKKHIRGLIIGELSSFILFGIPSILAVVYFNMWLFLIIVIGGMIMAFLASFSTLEANYPNKIVIEQNEIYIEMNRGCVENSFEDIKEIIDWNSFYEIKFYFPNQFGLCFCQKDLIVEGTIEEFEELFKDKIVRKYKQKD